MTLFIEFVFFPAGTRSRFKVYNTFRRYASSFFHNVWVYSLNATLRVCSKESIKPSYSLIDSFTHSLIHSFIHSFFYSFIIFRHWQRNKQNTVCLVWKSTSTKMDASFLAILIINRLSKSCLLLEHPSYITISLNFGKNNNNKNINTI